MGASASKISRLGSTTAAKRRYPQRTASLARTPPSSSSTPSNTSLNNNTPLLQASDSKTEAISLDARDPDHSYAQSLRALGPVTTTSPSSFSSSSHPHILFPSNNNPALQILSARSRLAQEAEQEFARAGRQHANRTADGEGGAGRRFLDVDILRQVLMMRDEKGIEPGGIERLLELKSGVVRVLGVKGVVGGLGFGTKI